MKLTDYQLRILKQNLVELMFKITKQYQSDIIIDFEKLDSLNQEGDIPEYMIFVCRECGTSLGDMSDACVDYYIGQDSTAQFYEIDFKTLSKISSIEEYFTGESDNYLGNYSEIRWEDSKWYCICQIYPPKNI